VTDLRAAVFAYSEVGYVCLEELLRRGVTVEALFTYEDDPGEEIWFPSVAKLGREAGVPVHTPVSLGDAEYELLLSLRPDVIFSFYYRSMIPERFLRIPPLGAFNMHGSLLPKYRGRACINWAVLRGEHETGATLHWMTPRPDDGDIVDQERVSITGTDTAMDVMIKVAEAAERVIARNLPLLERGKAPRIPQDHSKATCFGGRGPEDGQIDWNATARDICNLVRAVTRPYPGAFTFLDGEKVFIWKATPLDEDTGAAPGTVLSRDPLIVVAGEGAVRVDEMTKSVNGKR